MPREHNGDSARYYGLTFWTPNINIFRDPRWGRGQETYGEDPFLTARLAVAFISGLQGDDPHYLKAMACAKHFAVHSGPEPTRHAFRRRTRRSAIFTKPICRSLKRPCAKGTLARSWAPTIASMARPACANALLLTDLLREQWGFDGHVVSDCGAIYDIYANHKFVADRRGSRGAPP